ncbi:MAG: trigger factor [Gammaproteobacteria bacterium]
MQVSVTATGGLERRLEVAVPAQDVASEVEQRLKRISRTARLKGFRPGKAPIGVVRRQFGEQVHAEVVGDLMRSTFTEAVNQEKLKPAAGPRIEPIALEAGSDLKYAAVFEVMPEVKVRAVDSLTIERPVASVTDADIDTMIENMRTQRPDFTVVERPAQDKDRVTLDFEGRMDGAPFEGGQGKDVSFILGAGRMLPEFEAGVRGASAGEQRDITVKFPAGYANKQLSGKTAMFALKVGKVEEQSLPAVDAEFCRAFGVEDGTIESLRTEVRGSMERELADLIRARLRAQVLDALYRENTIEVPRALVDEQVRELQVDMARRIGAKDVNQLPPRDSFEQPARRRVALGLIIGEIVRNEQLKVDRERVHGRLQDLVAAYPNPDEVRRAYLQNADAMRQVESAVLEDQVIDWVVGRAKVTDRASSFKELTGFGEEK